MTLDYHNNLLANRGPKDNIIKNNKLPDEVKQKKFQN